MTSNNYQFNPPGLSTIEESWLAEFVPHHCNFSKPLEDPPPRYCGEAGDVLCHMTATFGEYMNLSCQIECSAVLLNNNTLVYCELKYPFNCQNAILCLASNRK